MTIQTKIVSALQRIDRVCDDCLAEMTDVSPRQSVNQSCRALSSAKVLSRAVEVCARCGRPKTVNRLIARDGSIDGQVRVQSEQPQASVPKNMGRVEALHAAKNQLGTSTDVNPHSAIEVQDKSDCWLALRFDGRVLEFQRATLSFVPGIKSNVFAEKNNKTVAETLAHKRYCSLLGLISAEHADAMDKPLGTFLLQLKVSGNANYKRFLNAYGDCSYCTFRMERGPLALKKGLYCYRLRHEIVYVGRSYDPFEKRINQGYGTIHPKNCYIDGQATNCHLNALIAPNSQDIELFLCPLVHEGEIERLERRLIQLVRPQWNIALKYE